MTERLVNEKTKTLNRPWCWIGIAVWCGGVIVGLTSLDRASLIPGSAGSVQSLWPKQTLLPIEPHQANLIIFAHPLCPCTRATLHELERLLSDSDGKLTARVLFFEPSHPNADWERGTLWDKAAAIKGVKVMTDIDGRLAESFGAKTSGWAVLYDADGRLRFAGGITAARGHEGDNAGVSAIQDILQGRSSAVVHTPVYGCALPRSASTVLAEVTQP